MILTIKSLNDLKITTAPNGGIIEFPEIGVNSDANTEFEFDDKKDFFVTFIFKNAIGTPERKSIDLSAFGLDVGYIIKKLKPVYDNENNN